MLEREFFGTGGFFHAELGAEGGPVEVLVGEVFAELFAALGEALLDEAGEAFAIARGDFTGGARGEQHDG